MRTVQSVVDSFAIKPCPELPAPAYDPQPVVCGRDLGLAVERMSRHTTDEGWQLFQGLERAGYTLSGKDVGCGETDVNRLVNSLGPWDSVLLQDKREWMGLTADRCRDSSIAFRNVGVLKHCAQTFRATVLKDAQSDRALHTEAAEEAGVHAWVVYYHPRIVKKLAPYVRERHLVRTHHSVDSALVPPYSPARRGFLVSGAVSGAYPLRTYVANHWHELPDCVLLKHPGYRADGCRTPEYLKTLSRFKVALCTSSVYGYALRKIVEATACGCVVVTDLPSDEVMPAIEANLVRVSPAIRISELKCLLRRLYSEYDPAKQEAFAKAAMNWYDYRAVGSRLAKDLEAARRAYSAS